MRWEARHSIETFDQDTRDTGRKCADVATMKLRTRVISADITNFSLIPIPTSKPVPKLAKTHITATLIMCYRCDPLFPLVTATTPNRQETHTGSCDGIRPQRGHLGYSKSVVESPLLGVGDALPVQQAGTDANSLHMGNASRSPHTISPCSQVAV